ncbi:MAG: S-layer homology domain-containing protein, partial [Coprothermobacterota bacterium]|nr:S-layer homology domain-containing protein [Coprothermobacterota bacterium]
MLRKVLLLLLVLVALQFPLGVNADISDVAGFSDVSADYWAVAAIADLADRSIIGGYPDGSFRPEKPVTRAEFAKMILLAMGFPPRPEISSTFPDITPDDLWAQPFIAGTVVNNLMKGYPDGTFRPKSPITMAEILTVLVRAQGWTPEDLPEGLTILLRQNGVDRPIVTADWFFQAVGTAARHGLLQFPDYPQVSTAVGSSEFALAANDPATRAQTALFLSRMLAEMPPLTPSPIATGEWKGTI